MTPKEISQWVDENKWTLVTNCYSGNRTFTVTTNDAGQILSIKHIHLRSGRQ